MSRNEFRLLSECLLAERMSKQPPHTRVIGIIGNQDMINFRLMTAHIRHRVLDEFAAICVVINIVPGLRVCKGDLIGCHTDHSPVLLVEISCLLMYGTVEEGAGPS